MPSFGLSSFLLFRGTFDWISNCEAVSNVIMELSYWSPSSDIQYLNIWKSDSQIFHYWRRVCQDFVAPSVRDVPTVCVFRLGQDSWHPQFVMCPLGVRLACVKISWHPQFVMCPLGVCSAWVKISWHPQFVMCPLGVCLACVKISWPPQFVMCPLNVCSTWVKISWPPQFVMCPLNVCSTWVKISWHPQFVMWPLVCVHAWVKIPWTQRYSLWAKRRGEPSATPWRARLMGSPLAVSLLLKFDDAPTYVCWRVRQGFAVMGSAPLYVCCRACRCCGSLSARRILLCEYLHCRYSIIEYLNIWIYSIIEDFNKWTQVSGLTCMES